MEADRINVHCCYQQLLLYSRRHRFENRPQLLPLPICLNFLALLFLLFYSDHVSLYLFACEAILLYSDCFHIACVSSFVLKNSVHYHINFTACFSIESVGEVSSCLRSEMYYNLEQFAGAS